jgi:hypothetical protein
MSDRLLRTKKPEVKKESARSGRVIIGMTAAWLIMIYLIGWSDVFGTRFSRAEAEATSTTTGIFSLPKSETMQPAVLDTKAYDAKLLSIAHYASTTSRLNVSSRITVTSTPRRWACLVNILRHRCLRS